MSVPPESLSSTLAKVSTMKDLRAALPSTVTSRLGKGDRGVNRTVQMLIALRHFEPRGTISTEAFNAIVAYDHNADKPFPADEAQSMLDTALGAGFLLPVQGQPERFRVEPQLHATMNRLMAQQKRQ